MPVAIGTTGNENAFGRGGVPTLRAAALKGKLLGTTEECVPWSAAATVIAWEDGFFALLRKGEE